MQKDNSVSFRVYGRLALFSDPITRAGGEKCSYQVPTYQALKGILESCYWKPTFTWYIDAVRVINPIQTQSKGIRPIKYGGGNDLSIYTYLTDVNFQVKAHFEWNNQRPDLAQDRNENKHYFIAKRMLEKGGRRDCYCGTRECQCYIEPCEFNEGSGAYDEIPELAFGLMFHSFSYPDENENSQLKVNLWNPVMRKGVIEFCRPEECKIIRVIRENQSIRQFELGKNFELCDDLASEEGFV